MQTVEGPIGTKIAGRDIVLSDNTRTASPTGDMTKETALLMTSAIVFCVVVSFIIFYATISAQHERVHAELVAEIKEIKTTIATNRVYFVEKKELYEQINHLARENEKLSSLITGR